MVKKQAGAMNLPFIAPAFMALILFSSIVFLYLSLLLICML